MTPAAWAFLGWAIFASVFALALLGTLLGDRSKNQDAQQQQLSETFKHGRVTGKLEAKAEEKTVRMGEKPVQ